MIRPFDWRDLGLLHQLRDQALALDSKMAHTRGTSAFPTVLVELFPLTHTTHTLVARPEKDGEPAAIGQLSHRPSEPLAHMAFVAPAEFLHNPHAIPLLEALCKAAGARGASHLIAEVDEHSPAFENLRRAAFAIYARQRIWSYAGERRPASPQASPWRPSRESDAPGVHCLYLSVLPTMVQQIEEPPQQGGADLTHARDGEILAYLQIERGPLGLWIQPYVHPAAEELETLLAAFLAQCEHADRRPLYFAVRSYQGWVGHALSRLGLQPIQDQAVMVKRLAARVREPEASRLPAVERTRPEPTTPIATLGPAPSLAPSRETTHKPKGISLP
jgi:hypothetical protein